MGCRTERPQDELTRLAIDGDRRVVVGRLVPGRGAWVCGPACFDRALVRRSLQKAFRGAVHLDADAVRAALVSRVDET